MTAIFDRTGLGTETGSAQPKRRPVRRRRNGKTPIFDGPTPLGLVLRYAALIVMLLTTIGPMLWELSTSLKSKAEDIYTAMPQLLPQHPTFGNYGEVNRAIPIWHFAMNSVTVAVLSVGGNILGTTFAGYALARLRFRGRKLVFGLFVSTLMLPGEVTIISQYQVITTMGFGDTVLGLAL